MKTKNSFRTVALGILAAACVAAALGAAFVLGQAGSSNQAAEAKTVAQATPAEQDSSSAVPQPTGAAPDGTPVGAEPAATETPGDEPDAPTNTATATATASATATSTPTGQCKYCLDGDLGIEPTPADPCPLCNDLPLAQPADTAPTISNISTSFCYPMLVVKFDLEDADVVWFSFVHDGVTQNSQHIDADTFSGFLQKDMGSLGWGVYFVTGLRVHAKDDQGHHVWSDEIPMPEPDLSC